MTTLRILLIILALGMFGGPLVACSGSETTTSTGEYVDDSVISNKVRANILGSDEVSILDVDVETFKGRVQLSGFVDSAEEKAKAGDIAREVAGVRGVENNLVIK